MPGGPARQSRRAPRLRVVLGTAAALLLVALPGRAAHAQSAEARLEANRQTLERIRQERSALERRMHTLQSSAHSLNDEITNLDRQHAATQAAVRSLDEQLGFIQDAIQETAAKLARAQGEVGTRRAALRHRLVEIYERGPLYDVAVLLSAASFGELVARYKYLHEIAVHDRALVRRVEHLQQSIARRQAQLVALQQDITQNRSEKAQEEARLQSLEQQRRVNLTRVQQDAAQTAKRLAGLRHSEGRLNSIIASIERARRRASSRASAVARGASSIHTSDYGRLDWPVNGRIVYNFGRVVNPNNTLTRWNGIGIAAPAGTPVHAVASGQVVLAAPLGTYGETVIVEHGGGDYSVYGSLAHASVTTGERIAKGAVIGTVGTSDPALPPHLHFEIRHGGPAVDPATWLRGH